MKRPLHALNRATVRAARVPAWVRGLVLLGALGPTLYWGVTGTGLYAWVASVQMQWMGSYLMLLTGMITFIILLLPGVAIVQGLATLLPAADAVSTARTQQSQEELIRRWTFSVVMLVFGLGVAGFGGLRYVQSFAYGDVVVVALDATAWPPAADYIEVDAELDFDRAVTWEEGTTGSSGVATHYVPAAADKTAPVLLVARLNDGGLVRARRGAPLRGVVRGAPSQILAESLLETGVRLSAQTRILDTRESPDSIREFGTIFGTTGLGMVLIGAIAAVVNVRRRR